MLSFLIAGLCIGMVQGIDWERVIRRTMELSGTPMKAMVEDQGIDRAQFERQLQGEGHLSLKRLGRLPVAFHRWFAVALAQEVGLPEEINTARRLEEVSALHSESRMSA